MTKKSLLLALFISFILFLSCENAITRPNVNTTSSITLGKEIANDISRTIIGKDNITEDTLITVSFDVLREDAVVVNYTKTVALKDLYKTTFSLKEIPYGNNYKLTIKILYKNIVIYEALSNKIELTEFSPQLDLSFYLREHRSSIEYETNGGKFQNGEKIPPSYFINSSITLPELKIEDGEFLGWYASKDFSGERITTLGSANFIGDVKLFAKWRMFDKVFDVTFNNENSLVDYEDYISLETQTENADIYYTLDGTDPVTSSTRILYQVPSTIKIVDDLTTIKAYATKEGLKDSAVTEASYNMKKYTVTFLDDTKGLVYKKIEGLRKNTQLTSDMLEPLSKLEHTFNGWYIDNFKVTPGYKVINDTVLTANWTEFDRITPVDFSVIGEVDFEDTVVLSCDTEDVKIYYTLDGTDPSIKSTEYKNPIPITKAMTIKAKAIKEGMKDSFVNSADYTIRTYTITFDNKNKGITPLSLTGLKKGDRVSKDNIPVITEAGYELKGWNTERGVSFDENYEITNDMTLFASWQAIKYTVQFDSNNGKGVIQSINCIYDSPVTLPEYEGVYTKSGYESINKWNTSADGRGTEYNIGLLPDFTNLTSEKDSTVTLYAQWNNLPPTPVTNVSSVPGNSKVTLTWKNPALEDVSKILISYDNGKTKEVPFGTENTEITGLTNGKHYTFTLKAIDNENSESTEAITQCFANPLQSLTQSMTTVSNYNGTGGTSASYVTFGDWPQSLKAENVLIMDESKTTKVNGWDCYLGNDNQYYVKVTATPFKNNTYKFSDNKTVVKQGENYYFKMEPIVWRVMRNNYNYGSKGSEALIGKLLVAEKALTPLRYFESASGQRTVGGDNPQANNYVHSEVRAFLNGYDNYAMGTNNRQTIYKDKGFKNKAFTPSAAKSISLNTVNNTARSTFASGDKANSSDGSSYENSNATYSTEDNIFLLSKEELTTSNNSFATTTAASEGRIRKASDFAKASGSVVDGNGSASWWSRSPSTAANKVVYVNEKGEVVEKDNPSYSSLSVVPAIIVGTPQVPVFDAFSIPDAGTKKAGQPLYIGITGTGFIKSQFKKEDFKFTGDSVIASTADIHIFNDGFMKVKITIPSSAKKYTLTIGGDGAKSVSSQMTVRETKKYNTGDVLLTNGTVVPKSQASSHKSDAAGVVFVTTQGSAFAVGLEECARIKWGTYDTQNVLNAAAYTKDGVHINNHVITEAEFYTGNINGSDNWDELVKAFPDVSSRIAESGLLSAIYFAQDYANRANLQKTNVSTGWFVPTIMELGELFRVIDTVNETLSALGKKLLGEGTNSENVRGYWTSNVSPSHARYINFRRPENHYNNSRHGFTNETSKNPNYGCQERVIRLLP